MVYDCISYRWLTADPYQVIVSIFWVGILTVVAGDWHRLNNSIANFFQLKAVSSGFRCCFYCCFYLFVCIFVCFFFSNRVIIDCQKIYFVQILNFELIFESVCCRPDPLISVKDCGWLAISVVLIADRQLSQISFAKTWS